MSLGDRIGRSLFVGLAVGLGWGIRGDFGHLIGAMYPGVALALGFAFVSGQPALYRWMPLLAAVSGIGIGAGGTMSYGILHGYAQADTLINYSYGFLTLFLQGSAWGTFGCAMIGLLLEKKPLKTEEWLGYAGTVLFGGWVTSAIVVNWLGFDINPPRNNGSIGYMGAAIASMIWLAANRKASGLRGAILGYVGFGLGMSLGRLLGNEANVLEGVTGWSINHWNVMETSCGFIGGFVFTFGMVHRRYDAPPENGNVGLTAFYGIVYSLAFIPLWHRIARIETAKKLEEYTKALQGYGYANPDQLAGRIMLAINIVCGLGFLGALIWLVLYASRSQSKWAIAFPVLWLSLTMILFQNLTAHYFFYPSRPRYVNMHNVFWILFGLMFLYVCVKTPTPVDAESSADEYADGAEEVPVGAMAGWLTFGVVGLALVIYLAGFVNGERTMRGANTRWPIWNWSQGPFPGK